MTQTRIAFLIAACMLATAPAFAQDLTTTFTSGNSEVIINQGVEDTEIEAEDFLSESSVLILTPKAGHAVARAMVVDGTQTTIYSAKRIRYEMATEAFSLEGDARIERGEEFLYAPKSIVYDPETLQMTMVGSENDPAKILYEREGEDTIYGESVEFYFIFKQVDGDKKIERIKTKGAKQFRAGDDVAAPANLRRKLSSPQ